MLIQVHQPVEHCINVFGFQISFGNATVELQSAHSCHNHSSRGEDSRSPTLDVDELLSTQVSAKSCLGDRVLTVVHSGCRCQYRITTVGNVGERSTMNKRWGSFNGLHEVGRQTLGQERSHRTCNFQISNGDRFLVERARHDNVAQAFLQIGNRRGQAEHSHDLTCHNNVEVVFASHPIVVTAQTDSDIAKSTVIQVDNASDLNPARVNS